MKSAYQPLRRIILLLALALLACAPWALAEGSFEAVVSVDAMKVYAQTSPHNVIGTLPRGTTVTVEKWSGKAALISGNGLTGIARVSDMTRAGAADTQQPTATPAANQTMVTNRQTRVYRRPSTKSQYVTLNAGTTVQVLSVNGNCAQVSMNGKVGYILYSHLSQPTAQPTASPTATPTGGTSSFEGAQTGNVPVVTIIEAQIYENPDYSGAAVTVRKGFKLTLLAVKGDIAMVTRNGAIGYIPLACLKKDSSASGKEDSEAKLNVNPFSLDSNEFVIFNFLINEMKLNRAATMGIMANMYFESGYRPVIDGDGGTSYGICQWHAGRKNNLINWCTENNLDYNTLEGQLKFLEYELPTRYSGVYEYICQVPNTADGAYDAAYYFCFNFEAPANRTEQSTKRGTYARDTLFPKQ